MEDVRSIIEKIYKDYNPDKISNIPSLIEKYKGRENEMLSKMAEKYSIRLFEYIKLDPLNLVTEILRKHDPVNITMAQSLLSEFKNRENELWLTLSNKYNANLNDIIISVYLNSPAEILPKIEPEPQISAPITFANNVQNEAPKAKKSNKLLIFGIPCVLVIAAVLILYFTGVFSPSKKNNNYIAPTTTTSVSNTDNSDSKTTNENNNDKIAEQPITISSATASSSMFPSGNILYTPEKAIDNDLQTWWSPAAPHSDGLNSWLEIDFGQSRKVVAIEIHNGSHFPNYPKYGNLYFKNNRLTKARLDFSDGSTEIINLQEVDEIQKISFPVKKTTYVKLVPLGWAKGTNWNDLCISHFKALGE